MFIGSAELARQIGCKQGTVSLAAKRLGIPKPGRNYLFTPAQAKQVTANIAPTDGKQPGPQPWIAEGISRQGYYWRLAHSAGEKRPRGRPFGTFKRTDARASKSQTSKRVTAKKPNQAGKKTRATEITATVRRRIRAMQREFNLV